MKKLLILFIVVFAGSCARQPAIESTKSTPEITRENVTLKPYPNTRKSDQVDVYFGAEVPDPWRWLEDDLSDETKAWVTAQNEVTFHYLDQIPFRDKIRDRLTEHWNYERRSAPVIHGDYEYFYINDGLQNHAVMYRRHVDGGEAEIFLNPNTFSKDGTTSLAGVSFTRDGSRVAYAISEGGSDWRKVIIMDTENRALLSDTLIDLKFSGLSWFKNEGIYYSSYDKPDGSQLSAMTDLHKLYYHQMGTPQAQDKMVFGGDETPRRYVGAGVSFDQEYLIISASVSTTGNELYIRDLKTPNSPIIKIIDNFDNNHSIIDIENGHLYIYTNLDAPNYRLVKTPVSNPTIQNWTDIIPNGDHVLSVAGAGGNFFASYMVDVQTQVKQFDYEGNQIREVELPGVGTAGGFSGRKTDSTLYYSFTSFTYPSAIFKYDIASGLRELFWSPQIDFNPSDYVTEQVFYNSKDGTRVPMFITYKKGIELDGSNPTYLYGYGGFNISLRPSFSVARLVWLENGGIYAQPNIRGGGEYGRAWHQAGIQTKKQNVFDDFIAAAEYLIEEGYTTTDKLAIAGGSNGGLLVGAVASQRPDLFGVAFPAVGVMDMLRYHTFTAGAGWAYDYGTSQQSEEMFQYLLGYSPVHNIKAGTKYPSTMTTTADHDDRVVPAHSFKYAAELQAEHAGDNPVIIRIQTGAGHGAGKPTDMIIQEWADTYAFAWFNMGVNPFK